MDSIAGQQNTIAQVEAMNYEINFYCTCHNFKMKKLPKHTICTIVVVSNLLIQKMGEISQRSYFFEKYRTKKKTNFMLSRAIRAKSV